MSTLGSPPPSLAPSAHAAGEKGNKVGGWNESRAVGFAGTWLRPRGAAVTGLRWHEDSRDSLVGHGEHLKLFGFVMSNCSILWMRLREGLS